MHQKINKRIISYFLLFVLFGTVTNINLNFSDIFSVKKIMINGLDNKNNNKILKNLDFLKSKNIFFLEKKKINKIINANNLVENYFVFKEYPSTLKIKILKTNILAYEIKKGKKYYIGSNGKYIDLELDNIKIPEIDGEFKIEEFISLKKKIDESDLEYQKIKKIYFFNSKRVDLELNNKVLLKLPKKNFINALNISSKILLDDNFKDSKIIDTRVINQVIING